MPDVQFQRTVDQIIKTCIFTLVDLGFVSEEAFKGKVIDTDFSQAEKLNSLQFAAAASINKRGQPVFIINTNQSIQMIAWGIAHESVHIAQICKGVWEPRNGYSIWKGRKFENLAADDPNYFSPDYQPWEAEANQWDEKVREQLYAAVPGLAVS